MIWEKSLYLLLIVWILWISIWVLSYFESDKIKKNCWSNTFQIVYTTAVPMLKYCKRNSCLYLLLIMWNKWFRMPVYKSDYANQFGKKSVLQNIFLTKGQLWFKDFVESFLKHKGTFVVTNVNNDFRMSSFVLLRLVSAAVFLVIVYGCECIVWFYHETLSMLKRMYNLVAKFHYDFKYFAEDVALDLLFVGIVIDSIALRICCGKNWLLANISYKQLL